jgi:small-conductance mechanosensitive channel
MGVARFGWVAHNSNAAAIGVATGSENRITEIPNSVIRLGYVVRLSFTYQVLREVSKRAMKPQDLIKR